MNPNYYQYQTTFRPRPRIEYRCVYQKDPTDCDTETMLAMPISPPYQSACRHSVGRAIPFPPTRSRLRPTRPRSFRPEGLRTTNSPFRTVYPSGSKRRAISADQYRGPIPTKNRRRSIDPREGFGESSLTG